MAKERKPVKKRQGRPAPSTKGGADRQRAVTRLLGLLTALFLLLMIVVMVLSQLFDTPLLKLPREMVAKVVTPIQRVFASGTDSLVSYLRVLKRRSNLEFEYNQLREEADELRNQAMLANALQHQLQAYADLADETTRNANLEGVIANVIGRDTSNYTYVLTLDVGRKDGIEDDMAVVVPGALIGITYDTLDDSTKVKGIIDSDCSVAALIESNRDPGTVSGTLAIDGTANCRMYYLSYTTLPRPGDLVVTSGTGTRLPKGIPIGRVRESTRGMEDAKQFIVLEPIADFDHVEYVIVYRYRPSQSQREVSTQVTPTFVPLPPIRPVPTLIGQPEPVLTPGPDGLIPETPQPDASESPLPDQSLAPGQTSAPTGVQVQEPDGSFSYSTPQVHDGTATPAPATASPSPVPSPTFSPQELTVEEDNP